uniref:Uncharacterized protein n=1 Tax=viral metagenome TaxID=1070528 RepID=A0A2V0RN27_9ZZZZ
MRDDVDAGDDALFHGITALDCTSNMTTLQHFAADAIKPCPDSTSTVSFDDISVQVLQLKRVVDVNMFRCEVHVKTRYMHCGDLSDTSELPHLGPQGYIPRHVSTEDCRRMHREGKYEAWKGHTLSGIKPGVGMVKERYVVGSSDNEGWCHNGIVYPPYGKAQSAMQHEEIRVMITTGTASASKVDSNGERIVGYRGMKCKTADTSCYDFEMGRLYWEVADDTCSREVMELYKGDARLLTGDDGVQAIRISDEVNDFQFYATLTANTSTCGVRVWQTEYPDLQVVKLTPGGDFMRNVARKSSSALDLTLYLHAKLGLITHLADDNDLMLYRQMRRRDCERKRDILQMKVDLMMSQPDKLHKWGNDGALAKVLGEALYIVTCPKVGVVMRKTDATSCQHELPITYDGKPLYLTPVTRVITNEHTGMVCSPLLFTSFHIGTQWFTPGTRHAIPAPLPLTVDDDASGKPHTMSYFAKKGIYSQEEIKRTKDELIWRWRLASIANV